MSSIVIEECKILNKGALHAKLTIYLPKTDQEIREVLCFKNDKGEMWFKLPAKKFQGEDGDDRYMYYVKYRKPETNAAFQKALREEFHTYVAQNSHELESQEMQESPF